LNYLGDAKSGAVGSSRKERSELASRRDASKRHATKRGSFAAKCSFCRCGGGSTKTPAAAAPSPTIGGELTWKRTLGRPLNYVTPPGWMLTSVNTPATIALDEQGRVRLRFVNIRNDELSIAIKARRRPGS
jgi:hypothetical protein